MFHRLSLLSLYFRLIIVLSSIFCWGETGWAQTQKSLVRYVVPKTEGASETNRDGKSWATAKYDLQDAIEDLREAMKKENLSTGGMVFVKAGIYTPNKSTEIGGGTVRNLSFKIYEGITVYGGFAGTESSPDERVRKAVNGITYAWNFEHETILDGTPQNSQPVKFTWNEEKQKYETNFGTNSYHVVWFATKGFNVEHAVGAIAGNHQKAIGLDFAAGVDGCTIRGGNTSSEYDPSSGHIVYGGGAYMVENSFLRNCVLTHNSAAFRGGAVFMDGGGEVSHCYLHTNQCLGVNGVEGYGGAVAVNEGGQVSHSMMVNNVARIGGGIALSSTDETTFDMLKPSAVACVIANNTAAEEAGGIFFNKGGSVNHLTVVRNRCNGNGVTINGIQYGRSAGAYIWECGHIYNSVFWGGKVDNRNIQLAVKRTTDNMKKVRVNYSGFENYDIVDWTGTEKIGTASVENQNIPAMGDYSSNYVAFLQPSETPGVWVGDDYLSHFNWKPSSASALCGKSVRVIDFHGRDESDLFAHIDVKEDLLGETYEPRDEVGAINAQEVNIAAASIDGVQTLFVDPSYMTLSAETVGADWDMPLNNLNVALDYFKVRGIAGQILVKEGRLNTLGAYNNEHMRSSSIQMVSHVTVKGGYAKELKGTDLSQRNPHLYVTHISGDLADDDYMFNASHLVTFKNVTGAVLDGFSLNHGNAISDALLEGENHFRHGGGIVCSNTDATVPSENAVWNCVISNCSAIRGSAVYAYAGANASVTLELTNTLIYNNASELLKGDEDYSLSTVFVGGNTTGGKSLLRMNHCNIMKNVGHPLLTETGTSAAVELKNSMVWGNASKAFEISDDLGRRENWQYHLRFDENRVQVVEGSDYCLFDIMTKTTKMGQHCQANLLNIPFVNPTKNIGISKAEDITKFGGLPDYTPMNMNPVVNAAEMASTQQCDMTTTTLRHYGGAADVGALESVALREDGKVIYVRTPEKGGNDANNGRSWATAVATLPKALALAGASKGDCQEIWVAAGTYTNPAVGHTRGLQLLEGIHLLGGFRADGNPGKMNGERDLSNSKPEFQTIVEGNGGRVIRGVKDATVTTVIEGVTIQKGRTTLNDFGAGIYLMKNNEMRNCLVQNNIYDPDWKNTTGDHIGGGGVYAVEGAVIKNCRIQQNKVQHDGNMIMWYHPYFCGAGVFLQGATIINSLIVENTVDIYGSYSILGAGAFISKKSNIYNCTFANNVARNSGWKAAVGGVWDNSVPKDLYSPDKASFFYNCIFWGNCGYGNTNENYFQVGIPGFDGGASGGINKNLKNCYHSTFNSSTANDNAKDEKLVYQTHPMGTAKTDAATVDKFKAACDAASPFNADYSLKDAFLEGNQNNTSRFCINQGGDDGDIALQNLDIYVDITGADRVQDCHIDKGAYEFDGTYAISPTENGKEAVFYVTQNGRGLNSGNMENPACAEKLQKVLDASGTYKLMYPEKKVVVRVAGETGEGALYRPILSTIRDVSNLERNNPRRRSLMLPRGVTVEGGWKSNFKERNIVKYKTVFTGIYQDRLSQIDVPVYHVVSFVEPLGEGNIALIKERAVIDGVHLYHGSATGNDELDKYGGAAIVPKFAHVRNCILRENEAAQGGGALLLMPSALVSGCLMEMNRARHGGAIYVMDITEIPEEGVETEKSRARIFTSTLVNNLATKTGGGIFYSNNVRVNSSVLWRNSANAQSDVAGAFGSESADFQVEDFPFAYSAVENLRLPGINNQSVATENGNGVRFKEKEEDSYYGLSDYSVLAHAGMPISDYQNLVEKGVVAARDFFDVVRFKDGPDVSGDIMDNVYIEVGARSIGKRTMVLPEPKRMLKRIYVVHPEIVKMEVVDKVLNFRKTVNDPEQMPLNAEQGASFAYPMQSISDALRYIINARKNNNIPAEDKTFFEIFISGGTFYPQQNLEGNVGNPRDYTFLVPEGVAVFGGNDPYDGLNAEGANNGGYLCQDTPDLPVTFGEITGVNLNTMKTSGILEKRQRYDLNSNNIFEPWELKSQTILSGKSVNNEKTNEVFHVVSVLADSTYVGALGSHNGEYSNLLREENGKKIWREPLLVRLDGLQIMNGRAWHEQTSAENSIMDYAGGGIYANGICQEVLKNENGELSFGNFYHRKIQLKISHCRFLDNKAGLGGAIMSNLPADISSSSFEQNVVNSQKGEAANQLSFDVKGLGAAIYNAGRMRIANCLFANNEAMDEVNVYPKDPTDLKQIYGAGTIATYHQGRVAMLNCNLVNNKARKYPGIFTQIPNSSSNVVGKQHNCGAYNTVFWGNEAVDAQGGNAHYRHVINFENPKDLKNSFEALWFCAYEEGCGRQPVNDQKKDYREEPLEMFDNIVEKLGHNNCNIYLNSRNNELDGPNFTSPSTGAGADKFLRTANWLPYRKNNLTDNGWTYLKQNIENDGNGKLIASFEKSGIPLDYIGAGAYWAYSHFVNEDGKYGDIGVPIGEDEYMINKAGQQMFRISLNPNPNETKVYIDMGLYEYQHKQLDINVDDNKGVDFLWVTEKENAEGLANGNTWKDATSDLQRAIETLLCSRNGHDKVIYLIEGSYHPIYSFTEKVEGSEQVAERFGFRINTKDLNNSVITNLDDAIKGVKSLTILGGWDKEVENVRNIEENRSYLRYPDNSNEEVDKMACLFDISNALQYKGIGSTASTDGSVIPLVFDGLTFVNDVRDASNRDPVGGAAVYYRDMPVVTKVSKTGNTEVTHKLTIANCVFMNSGANEKMPTVYVGKGGGKILVKNSLFHSNKGCALVAEEAADVVNCTFALNGGNVQLKGDDVSLYANVFWRNNQHAEFARKNEFEVGPSANVVDNAYTDEALKRENNWVLSEDLEDIINGPRFVAPLLEATSNKEVEKRDFHLLPSVALLNKSGKEYWKFVDPNATEEKKGKETDLSGKPRLQGNLMDLGAYEFQQPLLRVIYADPMRVLDSGDGTSWVDAYNYRDLQRAVDMAAVYAASKGNEQAYVFVKARNDNENTGWNLILREGVSIYGSIPQNVVRCADGNLPDFEQYVRSHFSGIAAPEAYRTVIAGVKTVGTYVKTTSLEGVDIAAWDAGKIAETECSPVVLSSNDVAQAPVALKNVIVRDFDLNKCPVVKVDNGLLYNVLVRDCKVNGSSVPLVELGQQGWTVNTTLTTDVAEAALVNAGTESRFLHSIAAAAEHPTFNAYLRPAENKPVFKTENLNLRYQLSEVSADLDADAGWSLPMELTPLVNWENDYDLLGNPRTLNGKVDKGCYETWKVAHPMNITEKSCPRNGSVVYLMENAELHLSPLLIETPDGGSEAYSFEPAYLLLKEGASLYGHGAEVKVDYLTVEKNLQPFIKEGKNEIWKLMALPFDFDLSGLRLYDPEHGTEKPVAAELYLYDADKRAAVDYVHEAEHSELWVKWNDVLRANHGALLHVPMAKEASLRFSAIAPVKNEWVYEEDGLPKTVALNQYNFIGLEQGKPAFTAPENMGWNLVGMPYLVSQYWTGNKEEMSHSGLAMDVPHVVYLQGENGQYVVAESWQPQTFLGVGEAFFTQTAVAHDVLERVSFALPRLADEILSPVEKSISLQGRSGRDLLRIGGAAEMDDWGYRLGMDGLKWMAMNPDLPQIYLQNEVGTCFALAAEVPVEKELALGVRVNVAGEYTFALPQREDFADYGQVWLTDHETGRVTDLKVADYSVDLTGAGMVADRFTLKFGGAAPMLDEATGARYSVFVRNGSLHVRGLDGGEHIEVFDMAGRCLLSAEATPHEFTAPLKVGVYVVKVNGNVYKVR